MTITFYELAGANEALRFSPHCWKTRFALAHKGLDVESVPVTFTEKEKIAFSNQPLLPVIQDQNHTVHDSWAIAEYLEQAYPERPSLFNNDAGKALAQSINEWADSRLSVHVRPLVVLRIFHLIAEKDREYFRETREKRLGMSLEAFDQKAQAAVGGLDGELDSIREILAMQPFIGGSTPTYADIALMGTLMWLRCTGVALPLPSGDIVYQWHETMLDQYNQLGRNAAVPEAAVA